MREDISHRGGDGDGISIIQVIPFGINLCSGAQNFRADIGMRLCEDLWVAEPPSTSHALDGGATVIANLSASNETVSKDDYRTLLIKSASARLLCGYIYTSAGEGIHAGSGIRRT